MNDQKTKDLRKLPIYFRRKEVGLTVKLLSAKSGVRKNSIAKYELGYALPRVDNAIALARALDTTVEQLFSGAI